MVSRLRMKLDLLIQGVLLITFGLFSSFGALANNCNCCTPYSLSCIQITSAAQLWLWHHYRPVRMYLWLFLGAAIALRFGLHFFDSSAWLCLIAMGIAIFFTHHIYGGCSAAQAPFFLGLLYVCQAAL